MLVACLVSSSLLVIAGIGSAHALPPDGAARGFREGANHHLGDDGFVALYGRAPGAGDGEAARMHAHLVYVRALLGAGTATRPELAARRHELLGYLDDYIAKGTTPENHQVPWRNPVFIDDDGRICAVGYLIERSVGRALAERVAASQRVAYLEDIDLPEVLAWVAGSGFTLEELASIQPGYIPPAVARFVWWDGLETPPADGAWSVAGRAASYRGAWRRGQMDGRFTSARVLDPDGPTARTVTSGRGELVRGRGAWSSYYPSGALMARGPFEASHPHGAWTLFFPSGRVAAEGRFERGLRVGAWRFYHDQPAGTLLAEGAFTRDAPSGRWSTYDAAGALVVESAGPWSRMTLAGGDHIERDARPVDPNVEPFQTTTSTLARVVVGGATLHVWFGESPQVIGAAGRRFARTAGGWETRACGWPAALAARPGAAALGRLNRWLIAQAPCATEAQPLDAASAAWLDHVMGVASARRMPYPAFVEAYSDRHMIPDSEAPREAPDTAAPEPIDYLAYDTIGWDTDFARRVAVMDEWPHVDGRFAELFVTLPDRYDGDDPPEPREEDHAVRQ